MNQPMALILCVDDGPLSLGLLEAMLSPRAIYIASLSYFCGTTQRCYGRQERHET
jgi:hypothetical protein